MNIAWRTPSKLSGLVVRPGGALIATSGGSVFGIDRDGTERWRHTYRPNRDHLFACDGGVALAEYSRESLTTIVVVGDDGVERWRHEEDVVPDFFGFQAGKDRVVMVCSSLSGTTNLRLVFDAITGAVVRRDELLWPASWNPVTPVGRWWIGQRADGVKGLERIDPATGIASDLTAIAHTAFVASADAVYLETSGMQTPSHVIALAIEDGRELWRARGGPNLKLGLGADRLAWIEERDGVLRPVVCDRRSGEMIWTGDPVAPLPEDNYFQCLVNEHAIVVFGSYSYTAVYGYASPSPRWFHEEQVHHGGSALDGERYLESRRDGLTCWNLR